MKIKLGGKLDYSSGEYFEKELKPLLKHPLVEYLGEMDRAQTIKLLSRAKCNLHPTGFREPFGLTVLEAAYCGTPTLAIKKGSMPELIKEGKTGLLVEDFVEGIHNLEKCFSMDREYIAKRARKMFNYQNMAKGYIRAYKKIIRIYRSKDVLKRSSS
jgi:glycosyltransferase involved in cell wall biosynthesis